MAEEVERAALKLVERCLELDPPERLDFLQRRCPEPYEVRARAERLLAMDRTEHRFAATEPPGAVAADMADPLPDRIGAFLVERVLGGGGMGTVVLARRDDGLFDQRVAIKLVRRGLRDDKAEERFALERRILARLSHPGITRILDGGTLHGRPYLVMEYVEGEAVTGWLARSRADLGRTLALFEEIGAAVAHAHRSLVVHADIKPDNVLVTPDGAVKVVDFGVARVLAELEEDELAGPAPLTRAYAAPERLAGGSATIAADVYSLGALLHEMLTGARPEPGRAPSAVLGSRIAPGLLRGDLDAIVAKAMAAIGERFGDVSELVGDLERRRMHQPVRARPDRLSYRLRLFLRRHWIGLAFVTLIAAAAVTSTALYLDARRQRAAAEAQFEHVRELAKFQLFRLYDQIAEVPGTTAARAEMAAKAQTYLDRLAAIPSAAPGVRLELAAGLDRLASVQGVPRLPNLGQAASAHRNLARAAAQLAELRAERPNDAAVAAETALNAILRAQLATWTDGRPAEAKGLLTDADREIRRAAGGGFDVQELDAVRRSAVLDRLSWEENYPALLRSAEETLAWLGNWRRRQHSLIFEQTLADALNARGDARFYLGDRAGALNDYRRADAELVLADARFPNHASILGRRMISGYNVATTMHALGERERVAAMALDLVARGERILALESGDEALRRRQQLNREFAAQMLAEARRFDEAIAVQSGLVAERRTASQRRPLEVRPLRDLAFSQGVLGGLEWAAGDKTAACTNWRLALAGFERLESRGSLTPYDRSNSAAYVRRNREICDGRRPASAYRPPD